MHVFFADSLFVVHLVATIVFGSAQFRRILRTTKGLSVTWFLFWEGFLVLNLVLALEAHSLQPSRVTLQAVVSYLLWTIMVTADLGILLWRWPGWKQSDTITAVLGGAGIVVIPLIALASNRGIGDPMVKGWLAVFCKAIPQLLLAYEIWTARGGGPPHATIAAGHITVLTRLGQLGFSIAEAGWDQNRIASAFSETLNEFTWIVVTIMVFRFRKAAD